MDSWDCDLDSYSPSILRPSMGPSYVTHSLKEPAKRRTLLALARFGDGPEAMISLLRRPARELTCTSFASYDLGLIGRHAVLSQKEYRFLD